MNSGCLLSPYHLLYNLTIYASSCAVTESVLTGPADARLRIVSERVDLIDNLVISVSVSYGVTHLP